MTLSALIRKDGLRRFATAIPATPATEEDKKGESVATIATVAVAKPQGPEIDVMEESPPHAWVVDEVRDGGRLRGVKIRSALLEDHLWLILDRTFTPGDGQAVYYPEELPELRTKGPEELREIHKVKLAFPGAMVTQEGGER